MDYDINAYRSKEELRRPKIIRFRPNHFEEWDDHDFFVRFRNYCLTPQNQLMLALRFYATGSFLSVAADFCGVSKSTASKTVRRVSKAIAALREHYIKMPQTNEEVRECRQAFYNIARFPRCIGAIDCSHIKIQSPGGNNAEIYKNRKQFFSLNVQTVADANLKIEDIVCRWPGSAHDAHIFRNSVICQSFENGNFEDSLIVGDSGYPIKPYLITPLHEVRNIADNLFNESLIRTRNVAERIYGVWKRRFPGLALGLRLKLDTIQAMTVATAILHNIARNNNEVEPPINQEEAAAIVLVNN
ncbi:hypothetical protein NQ317_010531 [Molorchus minor]|uniref:DDE Tnp4 domain-containing protein n=1 Tax=Molorchus minor TaxID=1323400 RepID=A0ABQ9JY41_9CUCU|nr:hypothetical protein NQ317_010531 [Molorchus minor]